MMRPNCFFQIKTHTHCMSSTFCVSYILPTQSRDFGAFPNPAKNVRDHFFSTLLMNEIKTACSLQNRRANSHSTQEKLSNGIQVVSIDCLTGF